MAIRFKHEILFAECLDAFLQNFLRCCCSTQAYSFFNLIPCSCRAAVFYGSGCNSVDELVGRCREWAPRKRQELQQFFGFSKSSSQDHPDFAATQGMSEDEELDYLKTKYMQDLYKTDEVEVERNV